MATFRFTNLTAERVHLFDFYGFQLEANQTRDLEDRDPIEASGLADTQAKIAAGTISMVVINSADENASGLASPPNSITGDDFQPVADAAVLSGEACIRKAFAAGVTTGADDVVIYADGAVPFKMRILDVIFYVSASQASTLELQDAEGGTGATLASVSGAATGRIVDTTMDSTAVIDETSGLVVRRGHDGIAGEVVIRFRPEI